MLVTYDQNNLFFRKVTVFDKVTVFPLFTIFIIIRNVFHVIAYLR